MRRQLVVLVVATTSLVLIAFLVPLGYLLREVAEDRAVNAATREAEGLAPVVATVDRATLELTLSQAGQDDYPITVFLPGGQVLGEKAARSEGVRLAARGRSLVVDTGSGREVLVAVAGVEGGTAVVRSFVPDAELHSGVTRAWLILGSLGVALLVLGVVVADRLARRLVRPLSELADVAHRLGAGDLTARVLPSGPREVREVGTSLNHLAGRIGELLASERESVADLSHRLRTPLTALRLDAESLSDPTEAARVTDDVDALVRTVDQVIREARRPMREGVAARCDASLVVRERVDFWSALAEEEDRAVTADVAEGALPVRLSAEDLGAVLDALLGNVFAHTVPGTPFSVRLRPATSGADLVIEDSGEGQWQGSTDPFARGSSGGASTGLGLDIVRRTIEGVGGAVSADPSVTGTSMRLHLPAADPL